MGLMRFPPIKLFFLETACILAWTSAVFGLSKQHPDGRLETEMIDAGCNQTIAVARAVHQRDPP
jgi:hypothetical protein